LSLEIDATVSANEKHKWHPLIERQQQVNNSISDSFELKTVKEEIK
jgi:hypothetical protein